MQIEGNKILIQFSPYRKRDEFKKAIWNFIENQSSNQDNKQRLLMVFGLPGVGKSYILREIAQKIGQSAICVESSNLISHSFKTQSIKSLFASCRQKENSLLIIDSLQSIAPASPSGWKIQQSFIESLRNQILDSKSTLKIILITQTIKKLDHRLQDIVNREQIIVFGLPEQEESLLKEICEGNKVDRSFTNQDLQVIASKTEGFSNCDIILIIKDAQYAPLRRLVAAKKFKKLQNGKYTVAGPDQDGQKMNFNQVSHNFDITVSTKDLFDTFQKIRPTISQEMVNTENSYLQKWNNLELK